MARFSFRRTADASRSNLPDPETMAALSITQTWGDQTNERIQQTFQQYAVFGFASNAVVFACELQRIQLLSQAEFKYQNRKDRRLHGDAGLSILETPWPNGTTADLVARMEQHAGLAGNAFVRRAGDALVVMRPDWTDIVSVEVTTGRDPNGLPLVHREVIGYLYSEGGIGVGEAVFYPVEDVAHWAPLPDPLSRWRGMSWMTPVLREINADVSMTQHRQVFFDSAATPNIIIKYAQKLGEPQLEKIKRAWKSKFSGPLLAGSTVVLDDGADLSVVGSTFESMRFGDLQAAGEARIASASGVPAIVAGLQSGLDAATYSNFQMAMKAFASTTGAYLWASLCASLACLVDVPDGSRLWYDTTAIAALQEAEKDRADTMSVLATAANTLLTAGFEATSIIAALVSGDLTQLDHTGMISVQLIPNDIAALKAKEAADVVLSKAAQPPEPGPGTPPTPTPPAPPTPPEGATS